MKLVTFNQTNTQKVSRDEPLLSFNSETGMFRFNNAAAQLLKLKEGIQIEFAQDEEKRAAWFLTIVQKSGFIIKDKKGFTFNNFKLSVLLVNSIKEKPKEKTLKLKIINVSIEHNKTIYWPIDLSLLK